MLPYGTTAGGLVSSRYLGPRASRRGSPLCFWHCGRVSVYDLGLGFEPKKPTCAHKPLQRLQPGAGGQLSTRDLSLPVSGARLLRSNTVSRLVKLGCEHQAGS